MQGMTQVPMTDGPGFAWQHNQTSADLILIYLWMSKRNKKPKNPAKNLSCGLQGNKDKVLQEGLTL